MSKLIKKLKLIKIGNLKRLCQELNLKGSIKKKKKQELISLIVNCLENNERVNSILNTALEKEQKISTEIRIEDVNTFFESSARSTNGVMNNIRETIVINLLNDTINEKFFICPIFGKKWLKLKINLFTCLDKSFQISEIKIKALRFGGRNNHFDFLFGINIHRTMNQLKNK